MSIDALADMSAPNRWRDAPAPPPPASPMPSSRAPASPASRRSATVDAWLARAAAARARQRALLLLGARASGHYQIFAQVQTGAAEGAANATAARGGPLDPAWREQVGVEVLQRTFDNLLALLACPGAGAPAFGPEAIALMRGLGARFAQDSSSSPSSALGPEPTRATLRRLQALWSDRSVQSVVRACPRAKLRAVEETMQALRPGAAESASETFVPTVRAVVCASASGPFQGSPMVEEVVFRVPPDADGKVANGGNGRDANDDSGVGDLRIVPANFRPGKMLPQVVQRLFLDVDAVAVVVETPAAAVLTSKPARDRLVEASTSMLQDAVRLVSGKKRAEVRFCVLLNRPTLPEDGVSAGGGGDGRTLAGQIEPAARRAFPEVVFTEPATILVDSTNAQNVAATMCKIARSMPAVMPSTAQGTDSLLASPSASVTPARGARQAQPVDNNDGARRPRRLWLVVAVVVLVLALLVAATSQRGSSGVFEVLRAYTNILYRT